MADIIFDCPHCGNELVVDARGIGMAVPCPRCEQSIEIPPRSKSGALPMFIRPLLSKLEALEAHADTEIKLLDETASGLQDLSDKEDELLRGLASSHAHLKRFQEQVSMGSAAPPPPKELHALRDERDRLKERVDKIQERSVRMTDENRQLRDRAEKEKAARLQVVQELEMVARKSEIQQVPQSPSVESPGSNSLPAEALAESGFGFPTQGSIFLRRRFLIPAGLILAACIALVVALDRYASDADDSTSEVDIPPALEANPEHPGAKVNELQLGKPFKLGPVDLTVHRFRIDYPMKAEDGDEVPKAALLVDVSLKNNLSDRKLLLAYLWDTAEMEEKETGTLLPCLNAGRQAGRAFSEGMATDETDALEAGATINSTIVFSHPSSEAHHFVLRCIPGVWARDQQGRAVPVVREAFILSFGEQDIQRPGKESEVRSL